jgi:hypothetical protein
MPGRPGWRVTFRNPVLRRVRTVGLDTRDEMDARGVCRDIEGLLSDPSLWQEPNSPRLRAYDPRAVRAVFGVEVESAEEDRAGRLSADDVGRLTAPDIGRAGLGAGYRPRRPGRRISAAPAWAPDIGRAGLGAGYRPRRPGRRPN